MKKLAMCALLVLLPSAAFAHPGDHTHLDWMGLLTHLFEPDHLFFAVLTITASVLAYRAGRRAEARIKVRKDGDHDPR